jgi:CheY-like chemotaxis protein
LNDRLQFERAGLLREKKEAAETANQAKARFLSSASHDLRQPAHALGLFMERIAQLSHDPLSKDLVAHAMAAVREMQNMLDAMFDMSHLDSETAQTTIRAFAVKEVFDSVRSLLESDALAKGLRLRIRASATWLESDSALLHRIVLNLVSNAIRYTERGTVLVACRPTASGTHARIEVWDSGIGIAPQDQEKVFHEFYQVGNPQRDRRLGLGVGLSLVDRCCRLLKHPLSLRSSLGAGTRMTLRVPIAQPLPAADPSAYRALPGSEAFTTAHVLLIEDDAMGRIALSGLLESWGYSVTAVEGAQMAGEAFQKVARIDLIISDFRLGGGSNGIDTIQMLRTLAGRELGACLISGDTSLEFRQQVKDSGLVLLGKPVRPGKLRSLLRHLAQKDSAATAPLQAR